MTTVEHLFDCSVDSVPAYRSSTVLAQWQLTPGHRGGQARALLGSLVQVTDMAERYGVSRKTVHTWLRRYESEGLAGLADRSHRPHHQPRQASAQVDSAICELRRAHRRWGPR